MGSDGGRTVEMAENTMGFTGVITTRRDGCEVNGGLYLVDTFRLIHLKLQEIRQILRNF